MGDSSDPRPGDVLAKKYRVERVLGYGGMGVVVAAWHLDLERLVAVKLLRHDDEPTLDRSARFAREARAVSRLENEHIVRVFDVGKLDDGRPYMVMEHLVGEDLEDALASERELPIDEVVGYVLQACEGMAEAHAAGIVHRDLKPANLFVTRRIDGTPLLKVLDFGIAKQMHRTEQKLTGPQVALGSPEYMSPEQARGDKQIGPRSDIWALGVCLYELLLRTSPFEAESFADTCVRVLTEMPPAPHQKDPRVPEELSLVVQRCLVKDQAHRFADVAELAEALEPFADPALRGTAARARTLLEATPSPASSRRLVDKEAPTESARPPALARKRRTRRHLIAPGLALLGVATLVIGWVRTSPAPQTSSVASAAASASEASSASAPVDVEAPSASVSTAVAVRPPAASASTSAHAVAVADGRRGRGHAAGAGKGGSLAARDLPPDVAPTASTAAPVATAPRFDLAAARVEVGAAANTVGTTSANVNRVVAPRAPRFTTCYRDALPQMSGTLGGAGTLHLETDEEGVIVAARIDGPITSPSRCIAASLTGQRVPNVDTGRARADVPLTFRPL